MQFGFNNALTNTIDLKSDKELFLTFYSAYTPPLPLYEHLLDLGFSVKADFIETGMSFCGAFIDGDKFQYDLVEAVELPQEHIEKMNLSKEIEELRKDRLSDPINKFEC